MKKIISLILAVLMLMALCVPAMAEGNEDNISYDLDENGVLTVTGSGVIPEKAFFDPNGAHNNINKLVIGEGITGIDDDAFCYCKNIKTVSLPSTLQYIGGSAFFYCLALEEINIPYGVTKIGNGAFFDCYALTEIYIPDTVTSIESDAFMCCKNLKTVSLPKKLQYIGSGAFFCCKALEKITIPDTVTTIEKETFRGCDLLSEIEIPDTVTKIGTYAFYECENLTAILYRHNKDNPQIANNAFADVKKLIAVVPEDWSGNNDTFGARSVEYNTFCPSYRYVIRSAVDRNFCLDIEGGENAKEEGDNLRLWPVSTSTAKLFRIVKDFKGYKIEAAHSGMVLDIAGNDTWNDGVNIYQWTDYGNDNQRWYIEEVPGKKGYYFIHSVKTGSAGWMDAEGCVGGATPNSEGKTNVYSWSYTGNTNQQWIIERVDGNFTGSTISEGNIWIVAAIGAVVVIGVAAVVIAKKKKKSAVAAETAEETAETEE